MLRIAVGGDWLQAQDRRAVSSGLTVIDRWPGGCFEMSWQMALPVGQILPAVRRGAVAEAYWGPQCVFSGQMSEPDWSSQSFRADGWSTLAGAIPALDGDLNTTSVPDVAIDNAISQGWWGVTRPQSMGAAALVDGDVTDGANTVRAVIDASAEFHGWQWGVDAYRRIWARFVETTPTWHMTPGAVQMGTADDEYASHVFLRFSNSDAAGVYATATATVSEELIDRFGFKAYTESLIDRGPMPAAVAAAIAQGVLDAGRGQLGWANTLEATRFNLMSAGGQMAAFPLVRAGQMVRLHGLHDAASDLGGRSYLDLTIAEVRWTDGAQSITLSPLGYARRQTFVGAMEEIAAAAGYAPLTA